MWFLVTVARQVGAGFTPDVINVVPGYGTRLVRQSQNTWVIDKADKVAFTGSTLTGGNVIEAVAKSDLKVVGLELGGNSPNTPT